MQTGFVTGYEVDVIHHTARVHPASVFSASSSAHQVSVPRDAATWMWSLACSGLSFFSARLEWHLFPLEFVGHPTQSGETILFWFGCAFSIVNHLIF